MRRGFWVTPTHAEAPSGSKGDRNAYEEIKADITSAAFGGRMRSHVWLRPDRTRASAVCRASSSTACRQSISSKYHHASTELQTHLTRNTKRRSGT